MPTLGEELKHRREERGITLAEISEETRIGTRFLKAIEADNFSILPGGIFTRSFIRAYAKQVGMDEDQAIGLYLQQVAGPAIEEQDAADQATEQPAGRKISNLPTPVQPTPQPPVDSGEHSRRFQPIAFRPSPARTNWSTIIIGAGIVAFVVIVVLLLVKQLNQGSGESGSRATSVEQRNASSNTATQPAPQAPPQSGATASRESPPATGPGQPSTSLVEGQPLVVALEAATGDSYVSYQVDDSKPTSFTLKKGETRDVPPAQNQVALKYGNRLVLKLRINNRDANFPPDSPKFASKIVISRDSLQTFFQ
ncbi:MAG TPA: helix-turn-helix domain-containing protein [Blastocatellia bacterium]